MRFNILVKILSMIFLCLLLGSCARETTGPSKSSSPIPRHPSNQTIFVCGEIIGKVFNDKNGNGYLDRDESGLAGVQLATAQGLVTTTDKHGRYTVPCVGMPDPEIGSNFIVKLNKQTLPIGYNLTTENPRVIRLTRSKLTKVNFGASVARLIAIEVSDKAFERASEKPSKHLVLSIQNLVEQIDIETSFEISITYRMTGESKELVRERLDFVRDLLSEKWPGLDNGNVETIIIK